MIFLDTETTGLHGMCVLIQWAEGDGPVHLHSVWTRPIRETLELIETFCNDQDGVCGFNLAFDWFHLCKLYTVLSLVGDRSQEPQDCINEIAELEPLGRDGPCLKPVSSLDLMLVARKSHYQSLMDRSDVRIKKVPSALAWDLAAELERRVKLSDIYFARRKEKHLPQWQVYDREDLDGNPEPDFKDIVLKFAPSSALKALAVDALKLDPNEVLRFTDVEPRLFSQEPGYAPYAQAARKLGLPAWPDVIGHHITHWGYYEPARQYAEMDVVYTRALWEHFGRPAAGDDDSVLATMVAAVRWKGYQVDTQSLQSLREATLSRKAKRLPDGTLFAIPTAPAVARTYVCEHMDATERLIVAGSTKRVLLEEVTKWTVDCPVCQGQGCAHCGSRGTVRHPSALRAREVLDARQAQYEADFYDKLLLAGRLHASFKVIGTLSGRMAGADDLNAQGIKHEKSVRRCFPLAWDGQLLCGGDFDGFEVTLADAAYNDPDLRNDLLSGKKIHALFGVHVFPDLTYEQILATAGTADDKYNRCKQAVFAMFYGGEGFTLKDRLGVDIEVADAAFAAFSKKYKQVGVARQKIFDQFCSMRQPGGIGSRVEWHQPADYVESLFGFRRYFTLENRICRALFDLANKPPADWKELKIKVQRRDRLQTPMGAVQSALYAAAFALQASAMRAASNHQIQSSGATITKAVQRKIWDLQPAGIGDWIVQNMNIHDEVLCNVTQGNEAKVKEAVDRTVESFRPRVPLLKMGWKTGLKNWSEK